MGVLHMTSARYICVLALLAAMAVAPSTAIADPIKDFYQGKRLQFLVRGSVGGNSDMYTRLIARYIANQLPGTPKTIVKNTPGGGGLKMVRFVAQVAPQDGTVIMMVPPFLPMEQSLGLNKHLKTDLNKLNWIGNMSTANLYLIVRGPSKTKTLEDAKRRVTIMASVGVKDGGARLMTIFNNRLGTKFKIIHGYPSGPDMNIAMLRGEVEGRNMSNPHLLIQSADPTLGKPPYHLIAQIGLKKDKAYPNVPLLRDLANNKDDQQIFNFMSNTVSVARPFATGSGVPKARVDALRKAFSAAMLDSKLQAQAKRQKMPLTLMDGAALQKIVASMVNSPAPIVKKIKAALRPKKDMFAKRKVTLVKVTGKVTGKKRKGRRIKLSNGKTYKISGRFTKKLVVNGKSGRRVRGKIKAGMTCTFMVDGKAVIEGDCK